jgi:two-component system sensor kinase FixL
LNFDNCWRFVVAASFAALLIIGYKWIEIEKAPSSPLVFLTGAFVSVSYAAGFRPKLAATSMLVIAGYAIADEFRKAGPSPFPLLALCAVTASAILLAYRTESWQRHATAQAAASKGLADELGLLMDGATDYAILMLDAQGNVIHCNKGAASMNGIPDHELEGQHFRAFFRLDAAEAVDLNKWLDEALQTGRLEEEVSVRRGGASPIRAQMVITTLHDHLSMPRGFAVVMRNVTVEREYERAMEARLTQLRSILETVPDAIIVANEGERIIYASAAAAAMFASDQSTLAEQNVTQLIPNIFDHLQGVAWTANDEAGPPRSLRAFRADGASFPIEVATGRTVVDGHMLFTTCIRDLTEQEATRMRLENLQAEVLHGSRRSAMVTMASTLAHEINQPMTAIANYLEGSRVLLAKPDMDRSEQIDRVLASALAEAIRVGEMVKRLRAFVDTGETMLEIEDLDEIVTSAVSLVRRTARVANVAIRLALDADAGPIFADRIQIQQVIVNLARNAIEAMRGGERGELTIRTSRQDDMFARVTVEDTGPGIPSELSYRLFDAFVSSKVGGLGVGLSICRTIIEAHGGRIWTSLADNGAHFHFTLSRRREGGGIDRPESHSHR